MWSGGSAVEYQTLPGRCQYGVVDATVGSAVAVPIAICPPRRIAWVRGADSITPMLLQAPFEHSLSACTWNTQGLFCHNFKLAERKNTYAADLCRKCDLVGMQEAHCGKKLDRRLDYELRHECKIWWSSCPGHRNYGAVVLSTRKSFLQNFSTENLFVYEQGRITKLSLSGLKGTLNIFAVHMDHNADPPNRLEQLRSIKGFVSDKATAHTLLLGDWNFDLESSDRADMVTGEYSGRVGVKAGVWAKLFPEFVEWFQSDFTRVGDSQLSRSNLEPIFPSLDRSCYLELDWSTAGLDPFRCDSPADRALADH